MGSTGEKHMRVVQGGKMVMTWTAALLFLNFELTYDEVNVILISAT